MNEELCFQSLGMNEELCFQSLGMNEELFEEAVDYAEMLSSDGCKDEDGDTVFQAAQELTDETLSKAANLERRGTFEDLAHQRDHDKYRTELRNSYVQDPLELAMAVSSFDSRVRELAELLDT